jgi:hypothetical protein
MSNVTHSDPKLRGAPVRGTAVISHRLPRRLSRAGFHSKFHVWQLNVAVSATLSKSPT